jgi:hypothetical protein
MYESSINEEIQKNIDILLNKSTLGRKTFRPTLKVIEFIFIEEFN